MILKMMLKRSTKLKEELMMMRIMCVDMLLMYVVMRQCVLCVCALMRICVVDV